MAGVAGRRPARTLIIVPMVVALVALLVGALRGRGVDRGPTGAGRGTPPEVGNN